MTQLPTALIVAGPTCSGKSALAFRLAQHFGGQIVNADSMQVYRDLRVLTARPSPDEEREVPHRLYGVLDAAQAGSVAWWRSAALEAMDRAWQDGALPILCGGTGMYMRALIEGLVEVPDPGNEARDEARGLLAEMGAPAFHARLMENDAATAAGLRPSDGQRIARAWEVWRGTGHGLAWWRSRPGLPPAACRFLAVRLAPARPVLRCAIAARFQGMIAAGALGEVAALMARGLAPSLPAMRAHGVPELAAYLAGTMDRETALERSILNTGRYTRRQATWFNHHPLASPDDSLILTSRFESVAQYSEREWALTETFIQKRLTHT